MTLDALGTTFSLLSTFFYTRMNLKAWPLGLLATIINGYLYWCKGIYGDMGLELFYSGSIIYGWKLWSKSHKQHSPLHLKQLSQKQWLFLVLLSLLGYQLIFILLTTLTQSTVAKMDAFTTSMSLIAQALMCYKVIWTWLLWFIVDVCYAALYLKKQLPYHAMLMFIYLFMALLGYWTWTKKASQYPFKTGQTYTLLQNGKHQ